MIVHVGTMVEKTAGDEGRIKRKIERERKARKNMRAKKKKSNLL